jgi:succinate dehydrogenase / fumarate reductase iron-sulfur subunit
VREDPKAWGTLAVKVQRFDPSAEVRPRYQEYQVPYKEGMTVLDALLYVKERIDHGVAIRFSCRMASCGSCGMKVNGRPRLACETQVADLGSSAITVQPMDNFTIVRDLVVDLRSFFERERGVVPRIVKKGDIQRQEQDAPRGEYLMTPEQLESFVQFTYCIKCGLCSSSCPTSATDELFPGPQALAQAYRFLQDPRDDAGKERVDILDTQHGVWRCHFAGTCSAVCPKGVDPALGIQLLKRHVMSATTPRVRKRVSGREGKGGDDGGPKVFENPNRDLFQT